MEKGINIGIRKKWKNRKIVRTEWDERRNKKEGKDGEREGEWMRQGSCAIRKTVKKCKGRVKSDTGIVRNKKRREEGRGRMR
jgi:hypothetical protein